ncbi:MAG TPA: glycine cleavage system aminomethyltransferase GcvT [Acidimicrobiales bacterium]|nr:glycine cleavage system aminomethyltransferase GcvT [Acidimicrobiales bacterium]
MGPLLRSPLHDVHVAAGAKLVDFGGWEMPLSYSSGTVAEHLRCRDSAVVFDVSHLGTVRVEGDDAFDLLQGAFTNDLSKIAPGKAQYTHLLDEADASVLDDIIVWWRPDGVLDVMPNASNTARVRTAIGGRDTTAERAILAVQGPEARQKVASALGAGPASVPRFGVAEFDWEGTPGVVAGTGYTGEDGVELAVPVDSAPKIWDALTAVGVVPAGLGARDTLRLEAALPLHGHELGPEITPLQAGLGWVVSWDKGAFRGRTALAAEKERGVSRRLRGIATEGRRPPREGCAVSSDGQRVGLTTSGNFSPVLGHGIALALLDPTVKIGADVSIEIRGQSLAGSVVRTPFVGKKS